MIDLQECRTEIDKIDSDIIRLFEQRMKVCEDGRTTTDSGLQKRKSIGSTGVI